jgi:pimeloyl-ACP methyl ester carboxylesterase
MTTTTVRTTATGPVQVTTTEQGEGQPYLLLHGGAGPQSVGQFAGLLAGTGKARVITPTHPGFGGTPRPDGLDSIAALAACYEQLLGELGLTDVIVVGNSIGGWIAAELALRGSGRVSGVVLVDAAGLVLPQYPAADFFSLTMDQVAELSYYRPDAFRIDLAALPEAQKAVMAGNRAALAVYGGAAMGDPTLLGRLAAMATPASWSGVLPTASSRLSMAGPTPLRFPARASSSFLTPAICPSWKRPGPCSAWSRTSPPR